MADSRTTVLILLILAYFIFANDTSLQVRDADRRAGAQNDVSQARHLLDLVCNSSYGDFESIFEPPSNGSNATTGGFWHARDYSWTSLPKVQERAREQLTYALGEWGNSALEGVRDETSAQLLYTNITGEVRGRWSRSKLWQESDVPRLNLSEYLAEGTPGSVKHARFGRNFTGISGDVAIGIREKELARRLSSHAMLAGNITTISAELTLTEDDTEQEEEIRLRGVYYEHLGLSILSTTSSKFAGILTLPTFALSNSTFALAQMLLNDSNSRMLASSDTSDAVGTVYPWESDSETPQSSQPNTPKCELIVWLQQFPVSSDAMLHAPVLHDQELRFPTGALIPMPAKLRVSMLVFSPDCGFILESQGPPDFPHDQVDHLQGYKSEILQLRARHHLLLYGLVVVLQLVFLVRQMREASTPSTRSRVSFFTIAMMVFADAFATIILTTISLFLDTVWITILGTASFALVNILLFGMRFLSDIWAVHAPERRRREQEAIDAARRLREEAIASARQRQQATYGQTNDPPSEEEPEQPDAPARPQLTAVDFGSLPVFMPSDQAGLQPTDPQATAAEIAAARVPTFGSMYMRFSFLLIMTLFLSVSAITYPGTLRNAYFTTLALTYLSMWAPQILRNVQRNCRKALKWEYVLSQSVLRLLPLAYFFGWEGNVLFIKPHRSNLAVMAAWVWIQVVILASQEIVGPRWFVKKEWVSPAWDYHPILRSDLEGSTLPLGLADAVSLPTSPVTDRQGDDGRGSIPKDARKDGKRVFDCAICMQELEVPVIDAGDASEVNAAVSGSLMLARRAYMVTPCRHIFHSNCLEGWMKYRLQCPICREGLPPM
ncbi:hypothetical protein AMS68_000063 [Peltaster fructicola]|uniref:DSC E3 ubiquitin ligase complex subunit A n=1 Tax=Peltaster fructicola TaxID=286661 RepID=A0A6H0XIK2_9PEZI|nr:hypothetical protein AMS68_000063 [Peltaster fructicola]